jgi:hypothetical protein
MDSRKLSMRAVLASALCLVGCLSGHEANDETDTDPTETAPDDGTDCVTPASPAPEELDLLLVMDDSGSMKEEQAKVLEQLPALIRGMASGDLDGDGKRDFTPITSLHLGVVSTNLGSAGMLDERIPNCAGLGDDGVLIDEVRSRTDDPACDELADDDYQAYEVGGGAASESERTAARFGCRAALGTSGCGLEQQLEAMWKALAPQSDADFLSGHGHGDEANSGFLRPEANLAVLLVSDEVDCSISEAGTALFDATDDSFRYDGAEPQLRGKPMGINFRCAHPSAQHLLQPITRYVAGLRSLKANPERVAVSVITGIPARAENLETAQGAQDFDAILALPEMQVAPDPELLDVSSQDALPRPACSAENGVDGSASPGRRFVELARGLGSSARVWSICDASYEPAFTDLIAKVAAQRPMTPCRD